MVGQTSIIAPLAPKPGRGWVRLDDPPSWVTLGYAGSRWFHPAETLCVISAVEVARDDDGIDRGPEYHISISLGGKSRCTRQQARAVLRDFACDGAEEDNHVPHGVVRNFWRPVADRMVGLECACKDAEPAIVEDRGDFTWRGASR
jgi:hypothetical protein